MRKQHFDQPAMSHELRLIHFVLAFSVLVLPVTGCGENRGLVPVSGRVTFDGGPPPKPGWLNFGPTKPADGFVQRPGQASFDAEGKFEVTSYQPGDGLTPGSYRINVLCVERDPPPVPGGLEAVSYIAPKYKGEEIVVAAGSKPMELTIDVPLKKRK
jgi:hypothetical protein